MKKKENDATSARPLGQRVINDTMVELNLTELINQIKTEDNWQTKGHNSITAYKSENLRIVVIGLKAGFEIKTHTANAEISVQVLEGKMNFTANQETRQLVKGQLITLQKLIPHSVVAIDETFFLLSLALK
jgi:quercetin dioxygenase-like cupin family protein